MNHRLQPLILTYFWLYWYIKTPLEPNLLASGQSRTVSTMRTDLNFCSSGRCFGSFSNCCSRFWKSRGASTFLWASMALLRTLKNLSTSSWECPLWRNLYSHRLTRCSPVIKPPNLKQQLLLTSRQVLSAWHKISNDLRSDVWATLCKECAIISQLQAESFFTKGNPSAMTTPWPWTMLAVKSKVGRMHPPNSFDWNIATWHGHLYFWWSMPSKIRQSVFPLSIKGSRLRARAAQ